MVFCRNTVIIRAFLWRVSPHGELEQRVRGGSQQPTLISQCRGLGSPPYQKTPNTSVFGVLLLRPSEKYGMAGLVQSHPRLSARRWRNKIQPLYDKACIDFGKVVKEIEKRRALQTVLVGYFLIPCRFNQVRAGSDDLFRQEFGRTVCGFVRRDGCTCPLRKPPMAANR